MKLKLQTAKKCRNRTNTGEGFGGGKRQQKQQQQQQREGLPTTVFQVDTVLGPGDDTSEARSTIPNTAITLLNIWSFEVHVSFSRATVDLSARPTREA